MVLVKIEISVYGDPQHTQFVHDDLKEKLKEIEQGLSQAVNRVATCSQSVNIDKVEFL